MSEMLNQPPSNTSNSLGLSHSAATCDLKIILLGDSAVGKSKLIERFLIQKYSEYTSSTRALSLYKFPTSHPVKGTPVLVNFYDTAGQERFASMHAAYYYGAHAGLLCFDLTRKSTYKNLENWYRELRHHRPQIPVLLLANKVDMNEDMAHRDFKFALDNQLEVLFVSASQGKNVVEAFTKAIARGFEYKEGSNRDIMDDILELLRESTTSSSSSSGSLVSVGAAASTTTAPGCLDSRVGQELENGEIQQLDLNKERSLGVTPKLGAALPN